MKQDNETPLLNRLHHESQMKLQRISQRQSNKQFLRLIKITLFTVGGWLAIVWTASLLARL